MKIFKFIQVSAQDLDPFVTNGSLLLDSLFVSALRFARNERQYRLELIQDDRARVCLRVMRGSRIVVDPDHVLLSAVKLISEASITDYIYVDR